MKIEKHLFRYFFYLCTLFLNYDYLNILLTKNFFKMKKISVLFAIVLGIAIGFSSCNPTSESAVINLTSETTVEVDLMALDSVYVAGYVTSATDDIKSVTFTSNFNDGTWVTFEVTTFTDARNYQFELKGTDISARDGMTDVVITATTTAADVAATTKTITVTIKEIVIPIEEGTFEWQRIGGGTATGLEGYGLEWKGNYVRDIFVKLVPAEGSMLYILDAADWSISTVEEMMARLATATPATEYFNVSAEAPKDYDDVLFTIYNGYAHLIHVTHANVVNDANGTTITITGDYKEVAFAISK